MHGRPKEFTNILQGLISDLYDIQDPEYGIVGEFVDTILMDIDREGREFNIFNFVTKYDGVFSYLRILEIIEKIEKYSGDNKSLMELRKICKFVIYNIIMQDSFYTSFEMESPELFEDDTTSFKYGPQWLKTEEKYHVRKMIDKVIYEKFNDGENRDLLSELKILKDTIIPEGTEGGYSFDKEELL